MIGIRELARICGVAPATASRALNGRPKVSPEARARVLETAKRLGYVPNGAARRMVMGTSSVIGIVVPYDFNMSERQLFAVIERHLGASGYGTLFFFAGWDEAGELACLKRLKSESVDGVVMLYEPQTRDFREYLELEEVPSILCTIERPDLPFPSFHVDEAAAAAEATRHLIALGHERIAYISGSHASFPAQRGSGYRSALEEAGLERDEALSVSAARYTMEEGRSSMRRLLAGGARFTAVFAATDELAIGAMRALSEAGLRVPDDVSVVGFDDIEASAFISPALTTVAQPLEDMGRETASAIARIVAGEPGAAASRLFPHRLAIRESTAPPHIPR